MGKTSSSSASFPPARRRRSASGPQRQWYDQDTDEWVLLLSGAARLPPIGGRLEQSPSEWADGEDELLPMQPGDYVHIPAHVRHRVEWTDPDRETVWLALHYRPVTGGGP